jgi:hypothetical protein
MVKWILIAVLALIVGLAAGFFLGRFSLERQWRQPVVIVTPEMEKRSAEGDADPTPKASTRILIPMPLERTRFVARDIVRKDPFVAVVATVGNGEEGSELHLRLENRGTCKITAYEGVAYGFDAWGRPQKMNKNGEHYIAFKEEKVSVEPKAFHQMASKMRYPETASLVVAHVDKVDCEGGSRWARQ